LYSDSIWPSISSNGVSLNSLYEGWSVIGCCSPSDYGTMDHDKISSFSNITIK